MDFSLAVAAHAISTMNHEARSALPDAPVVEPRTPGRRSRTAVHVRQRLDALKGWLAGALHQAAWAIEPELPAVTVPEHAKPAAMRTDDTVGDARVGSL
jgi:hypothetical protein